MSNHTYMVCVTCEQDCVIHTLQANANRLTRRIDVLETVFGIRSADYVVSSAVVLQRWTRAMRIRRAAVNIQAHTRGMRGRYYAQLLHGCIRHVEDTYRCATKVFARQQTARALETWCAHVSARKRDVRRHRRNRAIRTIQRAFRRMGSSSNRLTVARALLVERRMNDDYRTLIQDLQFKIQKMKQRKKKSVHP